MKNTKQLILLTFALSISSYADEMKCTSPDYQGKTIEVYSHLTGSGARSYKLLIGHYSNFLRRLR